MFQLYKQIIYNKVHDPALRFCAKVKKTPEETLEYSSIKDVFSEYETLLAAEKEAEAEKTKQAKQPASASAPNDSHDAGGDDAEMTHESRGVPDADSLDWWNEQAETLLNEYVKLLVDPGSETALMNVIKAISYNRPFALAPSVDHVMS